MEQYFKAARIPKMKMVTITYIYLIDDVNLSLQTKAKDNVEFKNPQITT